MTQYDCAFGQNLVLVCLCSFIACPYFRCKLREKYGIKVSMVVLILRVTHQILTSTAQGNIVFDALACWICCNLAQFQEFREVRCRRKAPITRCP